MMNLQTFEKELGHTPLNLSRTALHIAKNIAYPGLDITHWLMEIGRLAARARTLIHPEAATFEQAEALSDFLFQQDAFRGNAAQYSDPRNSFLNEVLNRRLGIPISLSILYVAVAQRLGLKAEGVGLPGHFIVRVDAGAAPLLLDPFNGGVRLTLADCLHLVHHTTGYDGPLKDIWLQPMSDWDTLIRLLNNLRNSYIQQEKWDLAARTIRHLQILQPALPQHALDLGLALYNSGERLEGMYYLEAYLLREPRAPKMMRIRAHLNQMIHSFSKLN